MGALKGKTVRQKYIQVRDYILPTPLSISQKHKQITLWDDVRKVNTIPFFLSISKQLYLLNVEFIEVHKADHFMM